MNVLTKTVIDTVATTGVIAPVIYNEPTTQAIQNITQSHDITAPLIALVSSFVIQLTLKGLNFLFKKVFKTPLVQD